MHILVTNDDGPPSSHASPYVSCLIQQLKGAGHTVSVCLPHTQRSWIGKAHMIGQTLKPLYYRPSSVIHGEDSEGTTHHRPSPSGDVEEWILVDGTPASCVQIGLHHFFQDRGPIDLVVSGPNYGRNTTAVFALSSGTLGAALEAAVCQKKAIALSFAFFSRNHDPVIIEAACRRSVKVIEALYKQWPTDGSADLYSVNVPLVEGLENKKAIWTNLLQNYWREGGCFQEIEGEAGDENEEEERIREGIEGEVDDAGSSTRKGHVHKHFKWAPRFTDVYKSVEESKPGNDGWAVKEGLTSVTALKANFMHDSEESNQKELELSGSEVAIRPKSAVQAIVSYEDSYVQPLILSAIESLFPGVLDVTTKEQSSLAEFGDEKVLQITAYESIDFEYAASHEKTSLINSYMIRKALIRKHYLSTTVDHWIAKNPSSILKEHVKRSEAFEVDFAEFLDDALVEAFDLRESMERNEEKPDDKEWWILKPGMSDRGQGIRLFSSMDELQAIFDAWEEDQPDTDDEPEADDDDDGDGIMTSHLRHFVAQPYIHPPLLVEGESRKFHIRTYVMCTGSLNVWVYKHMLALFAGKPYTAPADAPEDIESFLTNTCLQDSPNENTVRRFWDLPLSKETRDDIFTQICEVTGEVFEAAAKAMPIHFQTLPNAFEVFGLDFLVDAKGTAWLLEVNAFPDFKQTGSDLKDTVSGFWKGVLRHGVAPFFNISPKDQQGAEDMVPVRKLDLGRG
ncbi:survival protein sure-like phosphatase/nucleotidase [Fusarium solani]|uniref:Survival protein sure-like phosphatase/nucleotidase n=1 Tax=Fusarium solani TaxID=169388 RepID=A0A9P9REG5_FUSSL|nr:survival protein sure-like phosphatase/nucleotidase [Fusarium solani]KAH7275829.1 survival protein sure-like phosphatase/nucleotidase [Fusarium solani]